MKTIINNLYLMYVNDFLTVNGFANYLNIDEDRANRIIDLGRKINHYNWTNKRLN